MFSTNLREITLAKIHLRSLHYFTHLLKFFSNLDQLPSARINLTITLCLDEFDGLGFLGAYPFTPPKNVFITANIYIKDSQLSFLNSTGIKIMQNALGCLKVNITVLTSGICSNVKNQIPIMKNNIPYDLKMVKNSEL